MWFPVYTGPFVSAYRHQLCENERGEVKPLEEKFEKLL